MRTLRPEGRVPESCLLDSQGNPLRVYHGTGAIFGEFDLRFSPRGFWFTDNRGVASRVATSEHARTVGGMSNVRVAHLVMRRPLRLRSLDAVRRVVKLCLESQSVFDGIIWTNPEMVDPDFGPFTQYVVFSPEQVLVPFEVEASNSTPQTPSLGAPTADE